MTQPNDGRRPMNDVLLSMMEAWINTFGTPLTRYQAIYRIAIADAGATAWQPIETAPKTGPAATILLWVPELHGTGGPVLAHWAFGGGEEQPAFGPAWFYWTGHGFHELPHNHKPTHWMSLPRCPADWRT